MPVGMSMISGQPSCNVCNEVFDDEEKMVNSNGQLYHENCFVLNKQNYYKLFFSENGKSCRKVWDGINYNISLRSNCAQCFRPFEDGLFYEFDGRQYCEYDFQQLYAPCCRGCGEYIIGRVIKAMNANWHPECFRCEICDDILADAGFVKNAGRALCKRCNANEKSKGGRFMCHKCHTYIEEGKHIIYMGDPVHPWHYNCYECGKELDETCRKRNNELYCLRCHDKMGIPICGACKQPIEDERVVNAIGKQFHVDHFCCAKCEKPFYGNRHYEKNGLAYCETHFNQLFGDICFICNRAIMRDVVTALNKCFCVHHFICTGCNVKLTLKSKFHELDMKPLCLRCHEKLPKELRKRLKKATDSSGR